MVTVANSVICTSLYKSKDCLCVCVCVCVCASNISAHQDQTDLRFSTWLPCRLRVCIVGFVWTTMIPLINYFINDLPIPLALSTIATTSRCAPEPITAEPDSMTHLKKQADLYLRWRELDRDFAGSSVRSVHLNCLFRLMRLKESGPSLFQSVEIQIREDNKLESQFVNVCV